MSLNKVEKIEREIFRQGSFVLKCTVLTGKKGQNNNKLNAVYNKNYPSKKYADRDELTSTTVATSDFLVFGYSNFEQKAQEEIYASYPNIADVKYFVSQVLAMVTSNEIFNSNNSVNMKYQDYSVSSQALGGGKVLVAIPTSIQRDQNLVRGAYLFFNSEDKYIEMDVKSVYTLNEIVKSVDLLTLCNTTLMLGMMANMNTASDDEVFTPAPKSPLPPRGGGLFANRGNRFQPRNESGTSNQSNAPIQESSNPFDGNQNNQEETNPITPPAPTGPKFKKPGATQGGGLPPRGIANTTTPNPVTSGDDTVMSMANIMKEADNINFIPEEEGDINF